MHLDRTFDNLRAMLIRHEGLRLMPYRDTVGKLTIGIGRNLDDIGVTEEEARMMLETDIRRVARVAYERLPWMKSISLARQDVVLSMVFNMGFNGFAQFKKLIAAIEAGQYDLAAKEMLDSKWSSQVGIRAKELAEIMVTGKYTRLGS